MRSFLYHTIPRHYIYTSQPKYYDKIDVYYQPKSTLLSARKGHPEWWGADIQPRNDTNIVFTNPWRNHHEWWGY